MKACLCINKENREVQIGKKSLGKSAKFWNKENIFWDYYDIKIPKKLYNQLPFLLIPKPSIKIKHPLKRWSPE